MEGAGGTFIAAGAREEVAPSATKTSISMSGTPPSCEIEETFEGDVRCWRIHRPGRYGDLAETYEVRTRRLAAR